MSPKIGDYEELGYDYISLNDFNKMSLKKPINVNTKNICIAENLIKVNLTVDLAEIILNGQVII